MGSGRSCPPLQAVATTSRTTVSLEERADRGVVLLTECAVQERRRVDVQRGGQPVVSPTSAWARGQSRSPPREDRLR
jgi:hypothetical protein